MRPDDRPDTPKTRIDRATRAHRAIIERGHPDLSSSLAAWTARQTEAPPDPALDSDEHRRHARALIETHGPALAAANAPITIEGLSPPWLAIEIARATPRHDTGYQPGLRLLQADPADFFDGCAMADLEPLLREARVEIVVGPDAGSRLAACLRERDTQLSSAVITLPTTRTRITPPIGNAFRLAQMEQDRAHTAHLRSIAAREADRSDRDRLDRLSTTDRPRRVALIAGRFTTVLGPMSRDLAQAFVHAGWDTLLITEPNGHAKLTPLSYSRAIDRFDPDLIIAANHTRGDVDRILGQLVMPAGVPWITWVQDAMPHLLTPAAGAAIGAMDLAMGHVSSTMITDCGYPRDRVIVAPMVASETKFAVHSDRTAIADPLHIAAFTNHSETPEAMRTRLIRESVATPGLASLVERLADEALAIADRPMHTKHAAYECHQMTARIAAGLDTATQQNLSLNVSLRLVDRVMRHRTLEWARAICERRGWTMRLYGRGWAHHPTLGGVAAGELDHDESLARAYHDARITLHASVFAPMHQRLIECALAGGLPAIAITRSSISHAGSRLVGGLLRAHGDLGQPATAPDGKAVLRFERNLFPDADRYDRLISMIGGDLGGTPTHAAVPDVDPRSCLDQPDEFDADAMIGLLEHGFLDEPSLEALAERAIADTAWRQSASARIADRARQSCTHASLVHRIESHYTGLTARLGSASAV